MPTLVCTAVWLKSSYTISIGSSIVVTLISRRGDDLERRVERGGLARAGGAGDQDDAVRPADEVVEELHLVRVEAERRRGPASGPAGRRCASPPSRRRRPAGWRRAARPRGRRACVLTRPSCGRRFSAMSRRDIVLMRDDHRGVHDLRHASGCRAARRRCGSGSGSCSRLGSMWMSLARRVEGVLEHELDGVDDVLVARLDLGLALHAHELLEVAEVDAGGEVALGPLDRVAQAVELGEGLAGCRARRRPPARGRGRRCA